MNAERGFDQQPNKRELIKAKISTFNMLWDDTRPSQDIGQLVGLPSDQMLIMSTPESHQEAAESPAKRQVMSTLIDAFSMVPITPAGRRYFLDIVSASYDMGMPARYGMGAIMANLQKDDLGILEESKLAEREKEACDAQLATCCFNILGAFLVSIPDEEANKMSTLEISNLVRRAFTNQEGVTVDHDDILEFAKQNSPWLIEILQHRLSELGKAAEWADQIKETYHDATLQPIVENIQTFIPKPEK